MAIAELCKGSTNDSDSFSPGSNPGSAARYAAMVKRLRRRPLTAKTGVRVPVAVPESSDLRIAAFFIVSTLGSLSNVGVRRQREKDSGPGSIGSLSSAGSRASRPAHGERYPIPLLPLRGKRHRRMSTRRHQQRVKKDSVEPGIEIGRASCRERV